MNLGANVLCFEYTECGLYLQVTSPWSCVANMEYSGHNGEAVPHLGAVVLLTILWGNCQVGHIRLLASWDDAPPPCGGGYLSCVPNSKFIGMSLARECAHYH